MLAATIGKAQSCIFCSNPVATHLEILMCLVNALTGCAVKRRWSTAGVNPPGNWFAPPGSNQSSSGGNETAEASGAEDREGDLASMQAVT